ncbi:MAG: alpha-1,2-fucosyltransferase [Acidaminococcaceae bacterium]|nr:alpha-1,2-fucosyltransferase [Acidaminococcaceae bacterium]
MKIVKIKSGFGNQMFQYALAKYINVELREQVKLDIEEFSSRSIYRQQKGLPRIAKFNLSLEYATSEEIQNALSGQQIQYSEHKIFWNYGIISDFIRKPFDIKAFHEMGRLNIPANNIKNFAYIVGFWQDWHYPDKVWEYLKRDFVYNGSISDSTQKMITQVKLENSIFIGVRRGDFLKHSERFAIPLPSYYENAIKYMCQHIVNPHFYVFSDDIEWVKREVCVDNINITYRENEDIIDDFEEFLIMSNCKHSIISTGTFHWWGARLNYYDGKIVIAPKKLYLDGRKYDLIPPYWIKMDNEGRIG